MTIQTRLGLAILVVGLAAVPTSGFPVDESAVPNPLASTPAVGGGQDPGFGHEAKLTSPDPSPESYFGQSVALDGDTLAVSSPWKERPSGWDGSVYVFERDSSGWDQAQKIVPPNAMNESGSAFGTSLAMDGDTLIIAYDSKKVNGTYGAGVVYFYERGAEGWILEKEEVGEYHAALIGKQLALDGDTAFVSEINRSDGGSYDPETRVYTRTGGAWKETQLLEEGFTLGPSVDIAGAHGVLGTDRKDEVYVFSESDGNWTRSATLKDPRPGERDVFGFATATDGKRVIVGEFFGDQAHVFRKENGEWGLESTLPTPAGASDSFGHTVEIQGSLALVGAPQEEMLGWQAPSSEGLGNDAGAIYVYRHRDANGGGDWTYEGRLTALDAGGGDSFGYSMDLDEDSLAVGAMEDDHGNASTLEFLGVRGRVGDGDQGSAYVLSPDADGDNLANRAEDWIGTDKKDPDTDRDGVDDGTEVSCGWGPDDPSSPSSVGPLVATSDPPPVVVSEQRWWLCDVAGK